MKLLIISHTEHYLTDRKIVVGWGPTVNEINHLAPHFESITHVAMLHKASAPSSSIEYLQENIHFIPLLPLGGKSLLSKLSIIIAIPKVIKIVKDALDQADAFQLRVPTGIAVFLIPYLTWFSSKKGWFKYAGNWNQKRPPIGYRIQRWMLKRQSRLVTINGKWPNQPKHCLTFENPCLTITDVENGKMCITDKNISETIDFCYVGRLETPKGVGRIIEAFMQLPNQYKKKVGTIHLVGDGNEKNNFQSRVVDTTLNFVFHGFLNRNAVFDIYRRCHFFLMPTTASEGFPKVIAEAANFGCVPVVSNVSAIGQYIHHQKNGFLLRDTTVELLKQQIQQLLLLENSNYKKMMVENEEMVKKFTYSHYNTRIANEILNKN